MERVLGPTSPCVLRCAHQGVLVGFPTGLELLRTSPEVAPRLGSPSVGLLEAGSASPWTASRDLLQAQLLGNSQAGAQGISPRALNFSSPKKPHQPRGSSLFLNLRTQLSMASVLFLGCPHAEATISGVCRILAKEFQELPRALYVCSFGDGLWVFSFFLSCPCPCPNWTLYMVTSPRGFDLACLSRTKALGICWLFPNTTSLRSHL